MKKAKLVIFITIIFTVVVGAGFYVWNGNQKQREEQKAEELENNISETTENSKEAKEITIVPTRNDEIGNNAMWCGTFQLIWNDLKHDLAKQDIVFTPQIKIAENLNKQDFTTQDLSDDSYYKKYGNPSLALKQEIEKAIKDKFDETSDILDDFEWNYKSKEDYFLYVMLKKEFEFITEFEELEKGNFKERENVSYFGIQNKDSEEVRNQVHVIYYNDPQNFAISLQTKQKEQVILCKNPQGKTFTEMYDAMKNQEKEYQGKKQLQSGEVLKIPDLKVKEKKEFTQIQNKPFLFSNGNSYLIDKAIQTIEFELNHKGGKIKSEAGMMIMKSSLVTPNEPKREFILDDTFAIFLQEEGKDNPYFAARIDDMTSFQ